MLTFLLGDISAPELSPSVVMTFAEGEESFSGLTTLEEEDFSRSSLVAAGSSTGGGDTAFAIAAAETGVLCLGTAGLCGGTGGVTAVITLP